MIRKLILLLIFLPLTTSAQWVGDIRVASGKVKSWVASDLIEYQGVYHFGSSESESDLRVVIAGDKICIQRVYGEFTGDGQGNVDYVKVYENMLPVVMEGHKIQAGRYRGRFVKVEDERLEEKRGLLIEDTWSGNLDGGAEIGLYTVDLMTMYEGRFPRASIEILVKDELEDYNKGELRIMRNEVFARYGYIFRSGGEMEAYFRRQDWYEGQHRNVDLFLTEIEKKNIKTILSVE
ncbi:MAG: YARHG domain-containing protein [Bacteroidota bacterium]